MRIIYKILLGMLIFNVIYISFTPFFPTGEVDDFTTGDTTESGVADYAKVDTVFSWGTISTAIGTFVGSAALLTATGILSGGSISLSAGVIIGISIITSIISAIWHSFSTVFFGMLNMADQYGDFTIAGTFYTLFTIILGIIIALTIAELFSGQSGVDT